MSGDVTTPWAGKYLEVRVDGTWEYAVRAKDIHAAVIVAIDGDHVILVEQYRVPLGRTALEFPAGLVGDATEGEGIAEAAGRELEEETGYRAAKLDTLGVFASSPGMTSETFTLVLATGLEKVGAGGGVENEDITVHRVPLSGIAAVVEQRRSAGVAIDTKLLTLLGPMLLAAAIRR